MRELRNPARPLCQNEPNLDETIISERDSEEEDYHKHEQAKSVFCRRIFP